MSPKAPEPFIMPRADNTKPSLTFELAPMLTNADNISRTYRHIHPFLVLAIFYSRFSSTVEDPVGSLLALLPVLAVLQCIYCAICLPTSSNSASDAAAAASDAKTPTKQRKPGQRKPASSNQSSPLAYASKLFPAILSTTLALSAGAPLLTILLVLHGAPVTTHIPHTMLAGAHFALLATLPLFYVHGVSGVRWRALAGLAAPVDEVFGAALGTCVGAWLGAVPIPLDWDRDWQAWPVTIVAGMYGGWAVGKLLGGTIGWGKNISFKD